MSGPLAGVRVLDFSTTFSGPFCTLQLADFGADVIKVEGPGGDITRGLGRRREGGMAAVYVAGNRGKASLALDLKDEENRTFLEQLIAKADALVHNMRPRAAERIGIGPTRALTLNPRLVHVAITGYGTDGPYGQRPAYDDTIQAMSGLAHLQGQGGDPKYVAAAIADKVVGLVAAMSLVSALYSAQRTGVGQSVEVPMFETMVGFNLMEQWGGRAFVPPAGETGYPRLQSEYRRPYRTKDGILSVVVYHEGHWRRFLEAIGRAEILDQDRFRTTEARSENIDELYALLAEEMLTRTTAEWWALLDRIDVPVSRVKSIDDLFDDEHLRAVDFFQEVGGDDAGYLAARHAVRFAGTPNSDPRDGLPPDRLGEGAARAESWLAE